MLVCPQGNHFTIAPKIEIFSGKPSLFNIISHFHENCSGLSPEILSNILSGFIKKSGIFTEKDSRRNF